MKKSLALIGTFSCVTLLPDTVLAFLAGSAITGAGFYFGIRHINKNKTGIESLVVSDEFVKEHKSYEDELTRCRKILSAFDKAESNLKLSMAQNGTKIYGLKKDPNNNDKIVKGGENDYLYYIEIYKDELKQKKIYTPQEWSEIEEICRPYFAQEYGLMLLDIDVKGL